MICSPARVPLICFKEVPEIAIVRMCKDAVYRLVRYKDCIDVLTVLTCYLLLVSCWYVLQVPLLCKVVTLHVALRGRTQTK